MAFVFPLEQALRDSISIDTRLIASARPLIVGPKAVLHRYTNSTEKPTVSLGAYNSQFDQTYTWPGRKSTSIIDEDYAALYFTDAYLNYWNDYVGAGSTIAPVANYNNRIRSSTVNFKSHTNRAGTSYARNAAFKDRDVKVGDIAYVRGTNSTTYEIWTTVAGFVNETVAASIASTTADAANKGSQSQSESISQVTATPVNDVGATADGSAYESSADGYLTRTYTITCTQSSTDGDATTARLSVVSSDGGDNVSSVTPEAFGDPTEIGTKGLTVTFDQQGDTDLQNAAIANGYDPDDFIVGQQWRVTVSQAWTAPTATSGGTYTGTSDTRYIVTVTRGGQVPTVDAPTAAGTAGSASSGGSLQVGTYYAVYTLVNDNGETYASPVSSSFSTTSGNLTVAFTMSNLSTELAAGADSANIYLGTSSSGPFHLYKTGVTTSPTSLATAYNASTDTPPSSNTATVDARVGSEPQITVSTTTGVDVSGPTNVQAKAQFVSLGNYGVTMKWNRNTLCKGDIYYAVATAADTGAIKTLVLAHDLPDGLEGASDLDVRLFIPKSQIIMDKHNVTLNSDNWSTDQTYVNVNSGIYVYDSSWTDGGVQTSNELLPVTRANMYIHYREWDVDLAGDIYELTDIAEVEDALGTVDPDNPIAFSVYKALQNVPKQVLTNQNNLALTSANADRVRYTVLGDDPVADDNQAWLDVIEMITGVDEIYNIVPLTDNQDVHQLFVEHVDSESDSTVGLPRALVIPGKITATVAKVSATTTTDGEVALATINADPAVSTSYTYLRVPAGNAAFSTNGVAAGDIVRYQYTLDSNGDATWTEYVVDAVISEDTVRLKTGPDAVVSIAQKVEVWRNLSKDELVTQLTTLAASYSNKRVCLVWPDEVVIGASAVPSYHLCSIIAAVMGAVPQHQGLTNMQLLGVDAVPRSSTFFNRAQLNTLSNNGVFVVTQSSSGDVYVKRGVTTKTSPLTDFEEMIRRNSDMFAYQIQDRWAPYIGVSNINDTTKGDMALAFNSATSRIAQSSKIDRLGPAVTTATLTELTEHPTLPDRLVATVSWSGPNPLNKVELTIVI